MYLQNFTASVRDLLLNKNKTISSLKTSTTSANDVKTSTDVKRLPDDVYKGDNLKKPKLIDVDKGQQVKDMGAVEGQGSKGADIGGQRSTAKFRFTGYIHWCIVLCPHFILQHVDILRYPGLADPWLYY